MSSKAKIYLYKEGNECVSLTSGWGTAFNNGGHSDTLKLYDKYMQSSNPTTNSWVARSTTNKFNFNKYEELTLDYELSSKTTSDSKGIMEILSNTGTWTTQDNSIVKNKVFNTQNLDVGSYTETLDISDLNNLYYANLRSFWGGVRFKKLYLTTNENTILINSQDDNSINFSCNTFDNLITITKAEICINGALSKTYTSNFDNITYDIDKNLCIIGTNNIKIKVTYSQGDDIYETVEEVLTHTNTVNNLPTSSSLKELIDRQELLTDLIEVQKNTLKSILESKNVEVSDSENKLSILINKVNELVENRTLWLYKNGDEYKDITGGWTYNTTGHNSYSYSALVKNTDHLLVSASGGGKGCTAITSNSIDVTNFAKFMIEIENNNASSNIIGNFMHLTKSKNTNTQVVSTKPTTVSRQILTLDISSIVGNMYIAYEMFSNKLANETGTTKIYRAWLER